MYAYIWFFSFWLSIFCLICFLSIKFYHTPELIKTAFYNFVFGLDSFDAQSCLRKLLLQQIVLFVFIFV